MRRIRIKVTGQVQCVGYRYHTLSFAQQLGITGWVKNIYDGSVEILAEGTEAQLEAFIPYVREGPRFARVDGLVKEELDGTKEYYQFTIK